jgi:hypothetical protein
VDAAKFYLKPRWEERSDTEFADFIGEKRQSMVDQA